MNVVALAIIACAVSPVTKAAADARFVTFTVGGSATEPTDINAKSVVTGMFSSFAPTGFVRKLNGKIKTFSAPGDVGGTFPSSINKKRAITGWYVAQGKGRKLKKGFLRDSDGTFATFGIDGANVYPRFIAADGTIIGMYTKGARTEAGFVRSTDGTITTFSCPDGYTTVSSGNDSGAATGVCSDGAFIRTLDGTFTFFGTVAPSSINQAGRGDRNHWEFGNAGFCAYTGWHDHRICARR